MPTASGKKTAKELQEEEKLKEQARKYFTEGKFGKALPLYQRLSGLNPKDIKLKTKVAELLQREGKLLEACAVFREVAAQYSAEGFLVQAIAINKTILKINPQEKGMLKELADLYSRKGVPLVQDRPMPPVKVNPIIQDRPTPMAMQSTTAIPISQNRPPPIQPAKAMPPKPAIIQDSPLPAAKIPAVPQIPVNMPAVAASKPAQDEILDLTEPVNARLPPTPLLSDLEPQALERALDLMVLRDFAPGDKILMEGEFGDSIFIHSQGEAAVSTKDTGGEAVVLATFKPGDFFGEFAYFSDRRRHATVTAQTAVQVLELDCPAIDSLIHEFQSVGEVMQKFYRTRLLETLLAKSRIFSCLSKDQRQALARCFTPETHPQGDIIMREGEMGDSMVLIQEGRLAVETQKDGKRVKLAELQEGHFCGEFAVLTDAKRTADVTCLTPCKLLRLSKPVARQFFEGNPELQRVLKAIAEERVASTIKTLANK